MSGKYGMAESLKRTRGWLSLSSLTSSCRVGMSPFITQDKYRFFPLMPKATGVLLLLVSPCTKLMENTTGGRKTKGLRIQQCWEDSNSRLDRQSPEGASSGTDWANTASHRQYQGQAVEPGSTQNLLVAAMKNERGFT